MGWPSWNFTFSCRREDVFLAVRADGPALRQHRDRLQRRAEAQQALEHLAGGDQGRALVVHADLQHRRLGGQHAGQRAAAARRDPLGQGVLAPASASARRRLSWPAGHGARTSFSNPQVNSLLMPDDRAGSMDKRSSAASLCRMRAFTHPDQSRHTPRFFLQRGQVRANFEVPERATALLAGLDTARHHRPRPRPPRTAPRWKRRMRPTTSISWKARRGPGRRCRIRDRRWWRTSTPPPMRWPMAPAGRPASSARPAGTPPTPPARSAPAPGRRAMPPPASPWPRPPKPRPGAHRLCAVPAARPPCLSRPGPAGIAT